MKGSKYQWDFTALLGLLMVSLLLVSPVFAGEPVCAEVKIEIKQELTLERQGFDANMKVHNELDSIPLENVIIKVNFTDRSGNVVIASSDPNASDAKFFIRIDSLDGIDTIQGGTIEPRSVADVHWLIVPAAGAAEGSALGELYYVGAELSYIVAGREEVVQVAPDFIRVKPMPEITLDYFLTRFTPGDDPLTDEIELTEPFTLGVRVQNNGSGTAQSLKIVSAQPKIVENEQGLLIDFSILGSTVNGQSRDPSLLVDFGDIPSGQSSVGRWSMLTSLAGEFTEFNASFTHADELGGQLTSLVAAVNSHFLVHDVRVDLPGRDSVRDFLVDDNNAFKVFESDNIDTDVENQSGAAVLAFSQQVGSELFYMLTASATDGFSYIKLADPFNGGKLVKRVIRSDGKVLPPDNAWFSKERSGDGKYDLNFNLFDGQSTGSYILVFAEQENITQAPVMQFVPDRATHEGKQISFLVEASDPNGTTPLLSAENLPQGALLHDQGNGKAVFNWTPAEGQAGKHEITFVASDGELQATRKAYITVNPAHDTDGDGMDDAWELEHFGTLERDGSGDFDGDGISDLDEFLQGKDPTKPEYAGFLLGHASLGSEWQNVSLSGFARPVVFAGVPSDNEADPVLVRLQHVAADGFKLRLQEWNYLDDKHALESVPYLVLEAGRHQMSDGSIWEVGLIEIAGEERWQSHDFFQDFAGTPQLLLSVQSMNDNDPVTARARNVSAKGFKLALFEEEANADHGREAVGYLAIYSPYSNSNITVAGVSYSVAYDSLVINQDAVSLPDGITSLRLEEEQSADEEILHADETVAILAVDDAVFATDNTAAESDTVLLRRHVDLATAATPVITPSGRTISTPVTVSISSASANAAIYYTLDGSSPNPDSNPAALLYSASFVVSADTTIKAIARKEGLVDSLEQLTDFTFIANTAPQFIDIPDRTVAEGSVLTFMVQALDQNTLEQATLSVDLAALPGDAVFTDLGNGTGRFSWLAPDGAADASPYLLTFVATDAQDSSLIASKTMTITITGDELLDSDRDGMPDYWENQYSLDRAGAADAANDPDGDGFNNLLEYQAGTNPLIANENEDPIANIASSVIEGDAPLLVEFSAIDSADSDGNIIQYYWEVSDGKTYEGVGFSHTFTTSGSYQISLTVKDNLGASNTATTTVTVNEPNVAPVAVIDSDQVSGSVPLTVNFSAAGSADSDGSIESYAWDFGDGSTATGLTASHTWKQIGEYIVTLTVTDDTGAQHSVTASVYANPPPNQSPLAAFTWAPAADAWQEISFDGSPSSDEDGEIISWIWDFGDGSTNVEAITTKHTYNAIGEYTVTLTVTDNVGATHSMEKTVVVSQPALNLLENGSFEEHAALNHGSWGVFKTIPGWTALKGHIEIQRGNTSGIAAIEGADKLEMDAHSNSRVSTSLNTEPGQAYLLSFYYSPRVVGNPNNTNAVAIVWNDNVLQRISGKRKGWVKYSYIVWADDLTAELEFVANGRSDSYGGLIDDVRVEPVSISGSNDIRNGSFEAHGPLNRGHWGYFSTIESWTAAQGKIEIQTGRVGGIAASDGNAKLELDAVKNSTLEQSVDNLNAGSLYLLSLDYAARRNHSTSNRVELVWNGASLGVLNETRRSGWLTYTFVIEAKKNNNLILRGRGPSDGRGGLIDNVQLRCINCME